MKNGAVRSEVDLATPCTPTVTLTTISAASTPTATLTSSRTWPSLHNELLTLIRDFLVDDSCYWTLVSLACASRVVCELVKPSLPDPRRLVLGDDNVDEVFGNLLGYHGSRESRSSQSPDLEGDDLDRPTLAAQIRHDRLVCRLEQCRHLTIQSAHALEAFFEASELIGTAFPKGSTSCVGEAPASSSIIWDLDHLCLSADLLAGAAEDFFDTWATRCHRWPFIKAKHLCGTIYSDVCDAKYGDDPDMSSHDTIQPQRGLARPCPTEYILSGVLQKLAESIVPERATVHNLMSKRIPAIYTSKTRLFFRQKPPQRGQDLLDVRLQTKLDICDELGSGIMALNDQGERFEVIGLDDDLESGPVDLPEGSHVTTAFLQRAEEMTLHRVSQAWLRDLIERSVEYTLTKDAEPCESCGQK